mgnify:FL=1
MVNFVDTCILTNLLDIPGFNEKHNEVLREYNERISRKEIFILPIATIIETGNHIAHAGHNKYKIATTFKELIVNAIQGENGFAISPEITLEQIKSIMNYFPEKVTRENCGLGDLSIINQFDQYWKEKQPIGKMRIWSLDQHLANIPVREGGLKRRKDQ